MNKQDNNADIIVTHRFLKVYLKTICMSKVRLDQVHEAAIFFIKSHIEI